MNRLRTVALLTLALATLVLPAPAHSQDVLIRNARVHTLTAQGTLEGADVLVHGGRVVDVGSRLPAAGAQVIEANGRPLTPGLFGGITGLGISEIELESSTVDRTALVDSGASGQGFVPRPEFDVTLAFNPDSAVIGVNRAEGITFAMIAPMASGTLFAGQGAVARLDGSDSPFVAASRTQFLDMGPSATDGVGFSRGAQFMLLEQATREALPGKPLQAGDVRLLTPTGREVFARYLAGGRMAFAVDRAVEIRQVLEFATRHGVKPVIVGGAQASQVASLLARSKVPVVLEPLLTLPGTFDQLGASMENAAQLQRAGVPVMFTHFAAGTNQAHKVRQGAGVAVAHGLPWDAALAALTSTPADVFGLGAEAGRIMPGSPADLVLWSGDPLEVTSVAEQVWIGGHPQSMRSRQSELRDRYRPVIAPVSTSSR
ncbi:MAG: amidohydrolase family protein [Steroidobacteraceae bacterium]|jgi:imidazolonepropionase-like amidohydrolase|nr:amidohydrolase family protein [Steroidobacteraceae bacterium]MBP9129909.1 amidohydrolase family protein [Steroidobacteraceae bacterium]